MSIGRAISRVYFELDGDQDVQEYFRRHEVHSLGILTIITRRDAEVEAETLFPHIYKKVVVEIGAGVGLLAIEMALVAKHVYAIEACPSWTLAFTKELIKRKPANLTWIFGNAQSVVEWLKADVAIVYTRSDVNGMVELARQCTKKVIVGPRVTGELRAKGRAQHGQGGR